jgi:hypothetical protein
MLLPQRSVEQNAGGSKMWIRWLTVGLVLMAGSLSAQTVNLTFYTNTAPYAALGAPMGYFMAVTNEGTTNATVTNTVTLTGPDSSTYQLFSSTPTILPGGNATRSSTFLTTTYTQLTGAFTLTATVTSTGGAVLATTTLSLTVLPAPANGVAVSIGGAGPDSASLGSSYDFEVVTANLSSAAITVRTMPTLIKTDGKTSGLDVGATATINPGSYAIANYAVTTTQYSNLTGTYGVKADVFDSDNVKLATDTHNFTRNPYPGFMPSFTEESASAGMTATRIQAMVPPNCGGFPDFLMGGTGAAVADYDGDGFDDVFAVNANTGVGYLWHNNGDNTFTDMFSSSGIPVVPYESGASFADMDNDGKPDLLILMFNAQNVVLHNNGDGTFSDVSATAGITSPVVQNNISATWGDYDNDGFPDLYIAVHADCFAANQNDHLYHNNGNLTFTDVSSLLGGSTAGQLNGRGLAALFVDYNQDGRVDLYVANDEGIQPWSRPNVLWRNDGSDGQGGWVFTDVSDTSGAGIAMSAMGLGVSDYDRNGRYDVFVTNYGANVLLKQDSSGNFTTAQGDGFGGAHVLRTTYPSATPGVISGLCKNGYTCTSITWGTGFYDFNDDGWEDLYEAGGNTNRIGNTFYPNALFLNNQDGTFLDETLVAGITNTISEKMPTALVFDANNDGFMDIFQWGLTGTPQLFINNGKSAGNTNGWVEIKLIGTASNRDAVGARLSATVGGATMLRTVMNGGTYQGNHTLVQHFGLGAATQIDALTITWPSGKVKTYTNVKANKKYIIIER